MRERARETKATRRTGGGANEDDEAAVLEKIAALPHADRQMAERLHAVIKSAAPELAAKTWYGMPAYAKDGETICFFQSASKFKTRYATLGFSDKAALDEGDLWPTSYALSRLTPAVEARITDLVRRAAKRG